MRSRSVSVAALIGVGLCSACSSHEASADAASGSSGKDASAERRIVPWQVEEEGTAPLVLGIYDAQERVHCRFLHDVAGQLRCLPWGLAPLTETTWYADAKCQQRIYQTDPVQGKVLVGRPLALPLPRDHCGPKRHAVGILALRDPSAPHYGGTPCAPMDVVQQQLLVEMGVTELQPPDRWATGTEVDGPLLSGRLLVHQVESAEGTRFDEQLVDEHWAKPCVLNPQDCRAAAIEDSGITYEDSQCMSTHVVRATACQDPAYIRSNTDGFHALGNAWSGQAFVNFHGCRAAGTQSSPDGPDIFYEIGAPLGNEAFANVHYQVGGTGRFQLRGLLGDGGELIPLADQLVDVNVPRFHDTVANTDCNPVWTPEGLVRCLPVDVMVNALPYGFADSACTKVAYLCSGATSCVGTPAVPFAADANGEMRAVSVNTTEAVTTLYFGGACTPTTSPPTGFYTLGAALAWDQYPVLTERNGRPSGTP